MFETHKDCSLFGAGTGNLGGIAKLDTCQRSAFCRQCRTASMGLRETRAKGPYAQPSPIFLKNRNISTQAFADTDSK